MRNTPYMFLFQFNVACASKCNKVARFLCTNSKSPKHFGDITHFQNVQCMKLTVQFVSCDGTEILSENGRFAPILLELVPLDQRFPIDQINSVGI